MCKEVIKVNERIKELRSIVGLSQREFGERIGIVKTAVSKIEKGENSPREQTILSICREFNVNYAWLKEGLGEMFSDLPNTLFEQVADEYHLDELDKKIVKSYMQLTEEKRKVIKEYLHDIFISE
jgi:transcriptional regulator with XRE-family HTH domain